MSISIFKDVESKVISVNEEVVLLDRDVAELYGVETKRINEAVKNNPDRYPDGYILVLSQHEKSELVEKFDRFKKLKHSTANPKAFTEKGLYMLATILKGEKATQTTIAIVETFVKMRHLSRSINKLSEVRDKSDQQALMQKSGELIAELLDDDLTVSDSETSIELNFAILKFKHTVKKKKT
jgi:phage regulator Rha-like protein